MLVGGLVFFVTEIVVPRSKLQETNQSAFQRIHCEAQVCDATELPDDWNFNGPDYVLDKATNFVLSADAPGAEFAGYVLHYSEPSFIKQFETPANVTTPAGESWRLYSAVKEVGPKSVAVMVGYAGRSQWVDATLVQSPREGVYEAKFVQGR